MARKAKGHADPFGPTTVLARPAPGARLRLVSLRRGGGEVSFGGGLACVPVVPEAQADATREIAAAVIGPRPDDLAGTIDVEGRAVDIAQLPAPLLHPSAPHAVDRTILDQLWRDLARRRCAELESECEALHLQRDRIDAAIADAHERLDALLEDAAEVELEPAPEAEPPSDSESEPEPIPVADEITPRLTELLDAFYDLPLVPSAEARDIADRLDELAALPPAPSVMPAIDVGAAERRVAAARGALAHISGGVDAGDRGRIEECHRAVVEAEGTLFESRKRERPAALAAYQRALAAERDVLAESGVESYASYLVAIASRVAKVDTEGRLRAELELADAQAELAAARTALLAPRDDRAEREFELRARAAQLLGRFPADDAAGELRALEVEHPDAEALRGEVTAVLSEIGEPVDGDVVSHAIAVVEAREQAAVVALEAPAVAEPEPEPEPGREPEPQSEDSGPDDREREREAIEAELGRLEDERWEYETALTGAERECAAFDDRSTFDVDRLDIDDLDVLLDALLATYRAGDLLAGRLPIVIAGALDDIDVVAPSDIAERLAEVRDAQVIVVTTDLALAGALSRVGAAMVEWPIPVVAIEQPAPEAERVPEPKPAPEPDPIHVAAAPRRPAPKTLAEAKMISCSQCARPTELEHLVFVPGQTDLWCVECVEALDDEPPARHSRGARLLRRRA
jgi:hypothetical protein